MSMTTEYSSRLSEARALAATLDKLTRNPKRISPTAPWIIPATMIVVCAFALICIAIKLIMNYLNSKSQKKETFGHPQASSPDIPTTPDQDQASMATTASMKTRGGTLRVNPSRQLKNRPPPVSLYQIKQKQSPGSSGSKTKAHRAAMKAVSRAARAEANRTISRDSSRQADDCSDDNSNNLGDNSPNLSQRSDDIDDLQTLESSGLAYGAAASKSTHLDEVDGGHNSNQPEVHVVQIRDLEEVSLQHSQPTWSKTESDI